MKDSIVGVLALIIINVSFVHSPSVASEKSLPKVEDKSVTPIASFNGEIEKKRTEQILASLPKDNNYFIVTGEVLKEISKSLHNEFIRIDAVLIDLNKGKPPEISVSAFETRDRSFPFEVAWTPKSNGGSSEIMLHKNKIIKELKADKRGSKFRLWGRWRHKDGWLFKYRVLTIEDWQLVEW